MQAARVIKHSHATCIDRLTDSHPSSATPSPHLLYLAERCVNKLRQSQQPQRVSCGRCVKHDAAELGILLPV